MKLRTMFSFCTQNQPLVAGSIDTLRKTYTITLTNSTRRNVLSSQTEILLEKYLAQANNLISQNSIRSIWIKSTGPVFSAGHDLKELKNSTDYETLFSRGANICMNLQKITVPVICVVDGLVAGAGC